MGRASRGPVLSLLALLDSLSLSLSLSLLALLDLLDLLALLGIRAHVPQGQVEPAVSLLYWYKSTNTGAEGQVEH